MAGVTVKGADAAVRSLTALSAGAASARGAIYLVGTPLVYGFGIETGRHRGGRLARRAGGARMLGKAVQAVRAGGTEWMTRLVRAAVRAGRPADGRQLVHAVALRVLGFTQAGTPVRTGTLRRSFHVRRIR